MRLYKPAENVIFADPKIEKDFNSLSDNDWLKKAILKAIADFKENAFCGERIRKKEFQKNTYKNMTLIIFYGIYCPMHGD